MIKNLLVLISRSLPKYDVLSEMKKRINNDNFVTNKDKYAWIKLAILSL